MQSKYLLIIISAALFTSCSTAYKTGQTPDDVYYSPVREGLNEKQDERRNSVRYEPATDYEITMGIRDRRWREFRDDYRFDNSPYYFATCRTANFGYYYNPYYYPWAIYTGRVTYRPPVNTTPRMVNLNSYNGYNTKVATGKTTGSSFWTNPSTQYNNSNRSSSRINSREIIVPGSRSSSTNNSRSYEPSSNSGRSSSGSSSSGSSNSGSSVNRPGRGG